MAGNANPIGIIGAMDVEVALLKEACGAEGPLQQESCAGMDFFCGSLHGVPIVIAQCDVGMVNAAAHAQALIGRFAPRSIVNTGVAGSLDATLGIGDVLIARDAVNHVMDVQNLGYAPGQTPGLDALAFPCDETLQAAAVEAAGTLGLVIGQGRVASGDRFVREAADKQRIIELFGASCCEMEGAAIAQTCWLNKVPCAILRAISDSADGTDHIDYPSFEAQAARTCAQLVIEMLKHLS